MDGVRDVAEEYPMEEVVLSSPKSIVYRALNQRTGGHVAVKLLRPQSETSRVDRQHFLRAMGVVQFLRLPTFPKLLDFGFASNNGAFMVMDLVRGQELGDLAGAAPERSLDLLIQITEALQALSSSDVSHRNLSPDNVLVITRGEEELVQIIGFGTAAYLDRPWSSEPSAEQRRFCAPELLDAADWSKDRSDHRADIYSVAAIACHLLVAEIKNLDTQPTVHIAEELRAKMSDPRGLEKALATALRREPRARPLTYKAFANALSRAMPDDRSKEGTIKLGAKRSLEEGTFTAQAESTQPQPTAEEAPPPAYDESPTIPQARLVPEEEQPPEDPAPSAPSGEAPAAQASAQSPPEAAAPEDPDPTDAAVPGDATNAGRVSRPDEALYDKTARIEIPPQFTRGTKPPQQPADEPSETAADGTGSKPDDSLFYDETVALEQLPLPDGAGSDEVAAGSPPPAPGTSAATSTVAMEKPVVPDEAPEHRAPAETTAAIAKPKDTEPPPPSPPPVEKPPAAAPPPVPSTREPGPPPPASPPPPPATRRTKSEPPAAPSPRPSAKPEPAPPARPSIPRARPPWLVPVVLVSALMVVAAIVIVLILGRQPDESPQPAQLATPVPTPAAVPTPIPTPRTDPRLQAADAALAEGDMEAAREAISAITEEEVERLPADQHDLYDELSAALEGASVEEALADLEGGLRISSVIMLRRAVPVLSQLSEEELNATPELADKLAHARRALQAHRLLWQASEEGDLLLVMERAADVIELLPRYQRARELRDQAAAQLESEADAAVARDDLATAIATLERLRAVWPDRSGLAARLGRLQDRVSTLERQRDLLSRARSTAEQGDPEFALKILDRERPVDELRASFEELREEVEQKLAAMDAQAPEITVLDDVDLADLKFKKNDTVRLRFQVTDDYAVSSVRLMLKTQPKPTYHEGVLEQTAPDTFVFEAGESIHGNETFYFYLEASDRSGHTGSLGSVESPIEAKRKRLFGG